MNNRVNKLELIEVKDIFFKTKKAHFSGWRILTMCSIQIKLLNESNEELIVKDYGQSKKITPFIFLIILVFTSPTFISTNKANKK